MFNSSYLSGYEFVTKVWAVCDSTLDRLLRVIRKSESQAIEFKASFLPSREEAKTVTCTDPYVWNVLSDIIAIANTDGGCVLLGVNDKGEYADDFLIDMSEDEYLRKFQEARKEKKEWHVGTKTFMLTDEDKNRLEQCIDIQKACLHDDKDKEKEDERGHNIFILIIKPLRSGDDKTISPIFCIETDDKDNKKEFQKSILYYRVKGAAKKSPPIVDVTKIARFIQKGTANDSYDTLWKRYMREGKKDQKDHKKTKFILWVTWLLFIISMLFFSGRGTFLKIFEEYSLVAFPCIFSGCTLLYALLFFIYKYLKHYAKDAMVHILNLIWMNAIGLSLIHIYRSSAIGWPFWVFGPICLVAYWYFMAILLPLPPEIRKRTCSDSIITKPVEHPHFTIEGKVMDAGWFWEEIDTIQTDNSAWSWKLEKHKLTGHCRIIDPLRTRRSCGSQQEENAIFEKIKKEYAARKISIVFVD